MCFLRKLFFETFDKRIYTDRAKVTNIIFYKYLKVLTSGWKRRHEKLSDNNYYRLNFEYLKTIKPFTIEIILYSLSVFEIKYYNA